MQFPTDGSTNKDENKGISSIAYNFLGKPQVVNYTDKKVEYVYDAAGTKLTTKVWIGATLTSVTNYSGGFIYDGGTPAMSQFSSPEGRVVKNGANFEYQYALADHQGNTRVVFTSATPATADSQATFELPQTYGFSMDTTKVVIFNSANHTTSGKKVFRMNQTNGVGPAKSLKVYPGDTVKVEVWAYYEASSGYGTSAAALTTAIAAAFGGASGGGGESGNIYNGVNSALTGFGAGGNAGDNAPAAYLNYILFDQQYKVLDAGWTRVPTSANFTKQNVTLAAKYIKEAGYYFTYLSYEDQSDNYVYFDDYTVSHVKSRLVQANEYYPYGLQTANSWTRESNVANNFLYNGGTELNQATQVYDLYYRNYDPVLGRFGQVDPKASQFASLTPYNYGNNDPVSYNDPLGDCPTCDRFEDRFNVRNGPHDTGDPWRAYGGDPYLSTRGLRLYADMLERATGATNRGPTVYNPWCKCDVPAKEILAETNPNQNQAYRQAAELAVFISETNAWANKNDVNKLSANKSQFIGDQWMDIAFLVNDAAQAIYGSRRYAAALAHKLPNVPIHLPFGIGVTRAPMSVLKPLSSIVNGVAKVAPLVAFGAITTNVLVNNQISAGDLYMATVTGLSLFPGLGLIVGGGALLAEGISYGLTNQSVSANINQSLNGGVVYDWGESN